MEPLLEVNNLKVYFPIRRGVVRRKVGDVRAVDGVSFSLGDGEVLGLVGESGCGKTTTGKALLRLVDATDGSVQLHSDNGDADLLRLSQRAMNQYRGNLQIVFQDPYSSLNPALTIFQSLKGPLSKYRTRNTKEQREIISDVFENVNLPAHYMDRYPNEFSGGQRQRIGIARALLVNPRMIVCDEAVSALDVSVQAQVLNLLLKLREERGLAYLFISHNLSVVEYISDRIAVMYLGRIVELTSSANLYANPLHPYSRALLSAIPSVDPATRRERIVLGGDVPSPAKPPTGCHFHPRCPFAVERCRVETPILREMNSGSNSQLVACHRAGEV